jgi:MFS family permease
MNKRRWYIVGLLATMYIFSFVDRLIFALLVEPLKADLHITDTQVALLIGPAFGLLYAALGLPVAWLADRGNRTYIAAVGVILWSISTVAAGFAPGFAILVVLRLGVALGEAVLSPVAVSVISDHFARHERATPMAVFVCCGIFGVTVAYALGGAVIQLLQSGAFAAWPVIHGLSVWRAALVLVGLPGFFLALLLLLTTREPRRGHLDLQQSGGSATDSVGVFPNIRQAVLFYVPFFLGNSILMMVSFAALAWYPTYLTRAFGVTIASSGYLFSLALAMAAGNGIGISLLSQRLNRLGRPDGLVLIQLFAIPAAGVLFSLAVLQSSLGPTCMLLTVVGMGLMSGVNVVPSITVAVTAAPAFRGRLMAINLASIYVVGLASGPVIVALLSEHVFSGNRSLGWSMLALTLVATPVSWALVLRSWSPFRAAMSRAALLVPSPGL